MDVCNEGNEDSVACIRSMAQRYDSARQPVTAVFWYEQLISIIEHDKKSEAPHADYTKYIENLMHCGFYHRAVSFIQNRQLSSAHIVYRLLMAMALHKTGDHEKVLKVLADCQSDSKGSTVSNFIPFWMNLPTPSQALSKKGNLANKSSLSEVDKENLDNLCETLLAHSSLLLVIGKTYLAMDNRVQAVDCLKECLKRFSDKLEDNSVFRKDPFCFEALETLLCGHLLGWKEKKALLQQQQQSSQGSPGFDYLQFSGESDLTTEITKQLYAARLSQTLDKMDPVLCHSALMRTCKAEILCEKAEYRQALAITTQVLKEEEFYWPCIPVHIVLLLELNKMHEMFTLAHRLVDCFPDNALSWFAVGSYYYGNGQFEAGKKFLAKCTSMKNPYGAGWLLFGHAFAMEREHDQAMNCYFKAAEVLSGSHLPLLYIGLEYSRTNNSKLGDKFLQEARLLAPCDPFVLNELGVLAYDTAQYNLALRQLVQAHYALCDDLPESGELNELQVNDTFALVKRVRANTLPAAWEPLLMNLGHVCRKLNKFEVALACHRKALTLKPRQASTYGAIGYCQLLQGDVHLSVTSLHQALSLNREDQFLRSLLNKAMDFLENSKDCNALLGLSGPSDCTSALWMDESNRVPLLDSPEMIFKAPPTPQKGRPSRKCAEMNILNKLNASDLSMHVSTEKSLLSATQNDNNSSNNLSNIDEIEMDEQ